MRCWEMYTSTALLENVLLASNGIGGVIATPHIFLISQKRVWL